MFDPRWLAVCLLAQVLPSGPIETGRGTVTIAGAVDATFGSRDDEAFFNYTDYEHNALRVARLRVLGEWRIGSRLSVLGEARTENGDGAQLAALYVRWRPWSQRDFDVQIGRIPPIIGAFGRRAYGRDNVLIGTPLAYQYLTSIRPDALPASIDDLLRMRARGWRPSYSIGAQTIGPGLPIVSSFRWDTGLEAHWSHANVDAAASYTLGSPAAPVVRETNDGRTLAGRLAVRGPLGFTAGVSAARGDWIESSVLQLVPAGLRGHASQSVIGADAEFGYLSWLVRGEVIRATFELPLANAGSAVTLPAWSSFVETRWRMWPRWQAAIRVERLAFGRVSSAAVPGGTPWDAAVDRVEAALGFRLRRDVEVRAGWQQNWRAGGRVRARGFPAFQLLAWF